MGKQFLFLFLMLSLILMTACVSQTSSTQEIIDLSALEPLELPQPEGITPLRVSVAAIISPRGTAENYQALLDYLSREIGRPIELVQRRTYQETNNLVESGEVDIAFVCTSAYITGNRNFNMKLVAAPQVNGETSYHSLLIVPANSDATSFTDLADSTFAFTDPISFTGRVYPGYLVQQLGQTPDTFFARTFFTYSHDDAIRAVANGLADGAAVDSLVYDFALEREPNLATQVRVIHRSPPFGIPPIVVSPDMRPQQQALLVDILLTMHENPEGMVALEALGIEQFILIDDSAYDSVRQIVDSVGVLD